MPAIELWVTEWRKIVQPLVGLGGRFDARMKLRQFGKISRCIDLLSDFKEHVRPSQSRVLSVPPDGDNFRVGAFSLGPALQRRRAARKKHEVRPVVEWLARLSP